MMSGKRILLPPYSDGEFETAAFRLSVKLYAIRVVPADKRRAGRLAPIGAATSLRRQISRPIRCENRLAVSRVRRCRRSSSSDVLQIRRRDSLGRISPGVGYVTSRAMMILQSMVIDDLDLECVATLEPEAHAPLVVDADAVLAGAIASERLQPIGEPVGTGNVQRTRPPPERPPTSPPPTAPWHRGWRTVRTCHRAPSPP